jgi:putative RecB family exonuclease
VNNEPVLESDVSRKYSPSKLDTYKNCPRRYRYRYVDKIKRPAQSVEAFLGTCVHGAFEKLYEDLLQGKTLTLEEALAAFNEAWDSGWSEAIEVRKKEYQPEDWKKLGRDCVRDYYEANRPFDKDKTVAVEKRIGFPLTAAGAEYRVEGYIDRLALGADGAFEIHDYKTARTLPTQADVDSDWQLAIYDIAVRHNWPDTQNVRLIWHFVRHGKALVSTRSAEALASLKSDLAHLIERIKRDHEFEPKRSALCDWCEYRDLCPLFSHGEKVGQMTLTELKRDEGVSLVDRLAALDAQKKEHRQRIKDLERDQKALEAVLVRFARAHGLSAVAGLEGEAVIIEKDELKLPTKTHSPQALEALEAELRASPLWNEVSHLDPHRLLEGYEQRAWSPDVMSLVESLLERYAKRSKDVTVRFHRKKDRDDD